MSKEKDRSEKIIPVATTFSPLEKAFQQEATKANRFEQHLAKLVEMWNSYKVFRPEIYFKAIGTEFTSAEKSLKELGAGNDDSHSKRPY